jgi:hypothetical protein
LFGNLAGALIIKNDSGTIFFVVMGLIMVLASLAFFTIRIPPKER